MVLDKPRGTTEPDTGGAESPKSRSAGASNMKLLVGIVFEEKRLPPKKIRILHSLFSLLSSNKIEE